MDFNYKNIYITGSDGWLGQQVLEFLKYGDVEIIKNFSPKDYNINCFVLDQANINIPKTQLNYFSGDLRNINDCEDFFNETSDSILIHTAGIIHPKNVKEFNEINFIGTKNLINSAKKNNIGKIIVVSSNSPLGCNISNKMSDIFDENSAYNPYMGYGKSKMLMEKYLLQEISSGLNITILRPPWFYGNFMPKRQITFYKMIKNGIVPVIGNGKNLRSKVNVKNIVQAIYLSAINPISKGQIYWVADEKPYSYNEIISIVQEVLTDEMQLKVKKSKIPLPYFFGQIAQSMDYLFQKLGIYNQQIHVLSELNKNIACSIKKIKTDLGYNPELNLRNSLGNSLNKFKNEI